MTTSATVRNLSISQTVAEAIGIEMERNSKILVLGEDVGKIGGVFGATRTLQKRFGDKRVRDMPISEMAFTGLGVGLAMAGYRPLVEIMFVDFIGVCLEQVMNAMSKIPYMSGGNVKTPMVIKTAGGCIGSAAQHSQCLWGLFAHLPGMYVVAPSNPYDYKGLMASALESDNPVIYIEHKALLLKKAETFLNGGHVPEERYTLPLGKANVVQQGSDLTLVTLSASVEYALEATRHLKNTSVEIIDLRSVVPLDTETIAKSVAKTGRLLVVDEDYLSFGLSGEVVTRIIETLGPAALKQIMRHAVPDVPIPAARTLEEAVVPGVTSIKNAVEKMAAMSS
jgi:acetoin:2,6-dichlorophenolindophenol oxidoreductase subunit beta